MWALLDTEYLISNVIDDKVAELMEFLTLKYLMKESATTAEMLMVVTKGYEEHFPEIFREACQWMQLVFGIEVKEVAPPSHVHVLVPALGLAYDGVVSDEQIYPRTILLIMILSIIHTEGNRAPEEAIWEVLSGMGLYPGRKHCIYGEPRKVLTRDLVQEQYLACQEVPNSDPPRYEFLWGPRAHAETSAEAVLEFLGRLKYTTRKALPICQEQGAEGAEERDPCSGSTEEWRLGPGSGMGHIPVPHPAASVPRHF